MKKRINIFVKLKPQKIETKWDIFCKKKILNILNLRL